MLQKAVNVENAGKQDVKRDLAIARRMLAGDFPGEGVTAQFSARIAGESAFWLAGPACPEGALPGDASRMALDGKVLQPGDEPVSFAGLHASIYRARPDVGGIAFTSASSHTALAAHGSPLATYYQYGGIFFKLNARLEPSCELDSAQGEAEVVNALGRNRALFIAGWGALNVSENLRYAASEALCLMLSSTRQMKALRIGGQPMRDEISRSYQSTYLNPETQFRTQIWLAAERRVSAGAPEVFSKG